MKYVGGVLRPDDYPNVLERQIQLSNAPGWMPHPTFAWIWTSPDGVHYGEEAAWQRMNRERQAK